MKFLVALLICAVAASASAAAAPRPKHTMDFNHFWTFSEIDHYLEDLIKDYPDLVFEETYGRTSEGREIEAFVIRKGGATGAPKPTIIIESGLRAREWLGPMAAMYIIHELVEHPYNFEDILDNVDLVFIPVVNIDGYIFSFTAGNRLWSKTRRSVGNGCFGVDLDRNFQFSFQATSDPCHENFSGATYFSEPETQAVRNVIDAFLPRTRLYLSLQAFGQQIVFPYQSVTIPTGNDARLRSLASQAAAAVTTRSFTTGQASALNGLERGTSLDFAYAQRRIPLAFTLRMPQGGSTGFDFPEAQLQSALGEAFRAFLVLARDVARSG